MEDDDDKTVFQTEEDKKKLEKKILGENSTDDSEFDTTFND
ncbi:MAG TPA: hypothetical protein VKB27_20615 [Gammaproteobacteria bacterium]|nr:hypothetical protein [Gammaproteobacteria bacterium]